MVKVDIEKSLYDEIIAFCELNEIADANKFINEKVWNESHSRYQELQLVRGTVEHTNAIMETEVPNEMRTMDVVNWDVVNLELNQGEFWGGPVSA